MTRTNARTVGPGRLGRQSLAPASPARADSPVPEAPRSNPASRRSSHMAAPGRGPASCILGRPRPQLLKFSVKRKIGVMLCLGSYRFSTFQTELEFKSASKYKYIASFLSLIVFLAMVYPVYSTISDFDLNHGFEVADFPGVGRYSNTLTHCGTTNYLRSFYNDDVGWGRTSRTGGYAVAAFFVGAIILSACIPEPYSVVCLCIDPRDSAYYLALGCLFFGGFSFLAQGIGLCWGALNVMTMHLVGLSIFCLGGLLPGVYFKSVSYCFPHQSVEVRNQSPRSYLSWFLQKISSGKLLILRSFILFVLTIYEATRIVTTNDQSAQSTCRQGCAEISKSGGLYLGSTSEIDSTFFYCGPLNLARQMLFFNLTLSKAELENTDNRCLPAFVGSSIQLDKWYFLSAYVTCSCSETKNMPDGRDWLISQYSPDKVASQVGSNTSCAMGGSCLGVSSNTLFITTSNIALNIFSTLWTILVVWRSKPASGEGKWDAEGPSHLTYSCWLSAYGVLEWAGVRGYSGGLHLRTWLLCINIFQALIFGVILGWILPNTIRWEAELCLYYSAYCWFDHRMTMLSARARASLISQKLFHEGAQGGAPASHAPVDMAAKDSKVLYTLRLSPDHPIARAFCETESLTAGPSCIFDPEDQACVDAAALLEADVVFRAIHGDVVAAPASEPTSHRGISASPYRDEGAALVRASDFVLDVKNASNCKLSIESYI